MAETKKETLLEAAIKSTQIPLAKTVRDISGCGIKQCMDAITLAYKSIRTISLMILHQQGQAVVKLRNCRVCGAQYPYRTFLDIHCKNDFH